MRLSREVSKVPRDAIVMLLTFFVDGTGKHFCSKGRARKLAALPQPHVYGPYDTYIGSGVVGGYVGTFEIAGAATADLVYEIIAGSNPATFLPEPIQRQAFRVDARAMDRCGLKQSRLPPGSYRLAFRSRDCGISIAISFRSPWLVLALQSAVVVALLFQRRRRRQAEGSLKESEDRMTFTAASLNVGLWQFDRRTDELWAMEHCRTMFGLARNVPLTRETFLKAVHPEDRGIGVGVLRGALRSRQSAVTDVRVVLADGQMRWIRVRARSRLRDEGISNQLSGLFVDITDQKAAESEARFCSASK